MNSARNFAEIPLVDISALVEGRAGEDRKVAEELGRAARDVGFFYLTGHGLPAALFDDLIAATERFFALPLDEKMKV